MPPSAAVNNIAGRLSDFTPMAPGSKCRPENDLPLLKLKKKRFLELVMAAVAMLM